MDILFNQIGVQSSGAGSISHGSGEPDSIRSIVESRDETFSEMVLRLIDAKRESGRFERDSDFYHKAGIDRRLFSRFRKKDYHPDKKTALCTAIALNLDEIETQALLNKAGYTLSPSIVSDLIVRYCVRNRIYDSGTIDLLLLHYGQPALFD